MAIPDVSADALREAAAQFDTEFRSSPQFSEWESNLAQKYAIELEGRKYPVKKIISLATGRAVGTFSGGPEANEYVAKRGLKVVELRPNALRDAIETVLAGYPGAQQSRLFNSRASMITALERCQEVLSDRFSPLVVRTSSTRGDLEKTPWVAFLEGADPEAVPVAPFPALLFRGDGSGVHIALVHGDITKRTSGERSAQSDEDSNQATEELRAEPLVQRLSQSGFSLADAPDLTRGDGADAGPDVALIAHKLYERGSVPADARIFQDIAEVAEVQRKLRESAARVSFAPEIHLLLKWQKDRNPETIEEHKKIADAKGSVWWGKFGNDGMGKKWRERFRDQLDRGIPTKVFLSSEETVWAASLEDFTQDQKDVDTRSMPTYYSPDGCKLFVRLKDFRRTSSDWLLDHTVSANEPSAGSVRGLLKGAAKIGYLHMKTASDVEPAAPPESPPEPVLSPPPPERDLFDIKDLAKQTLLDAALLAEILDSLLNTQRQVVLAGPPGTSKTFIAQCIAEHVCRRRRELYRVVQFHPSYSYESFIEGLRPVVRAGGGIDFERTNGVVLDLVKEMRNLKHVGSGVPTYLILIDEMNRANLPRVFGELMYLFEYRDKTIRLQYSPEFSLPPNLVFIGTMNTADRSIRSIDSALRRRFDVFELRPDAAVLERYFEKHGRSIDEPFVRSLVEGFEKLNLELEQRIDRHHQIGHAFFMKPGLDSRQLQAIWDRKIFPLIEEYFFDQPDVAQTFTFKKFWPGSAE